MCFVWITYQGGCSFEGGRGHNQHERLEGDENEARPTQTLTVFDEFEEAEPNNARAGSSGREER